MLPIVQYADDIQFLHADTINYLNDLISNTEETLLNVKHCFLRNGLLLNPKKTQCIFIGNRQLLAQTPPNTIIDCDCDIITPSAHVKELVVYFDRYMLFGIHISELNKKIMGMHLFINGISENFDKRIRVIVVKSLILSLINCCISIWGSTNKTLLSNVQKLENFAAKVAIGGARKYDQVTPIMKELEWLTIKEKFIFEKYTTMYKTVSGLYPSWYLKFPTVRENSARRTRQVNDLHIPRARTHSGARAVALLGPKLCNILPPDVTNSGSLYTFKSKLKRLLLSDSLYGIVF